MGYQTTKQTPLFARYILALVAWQQYCRRYWKGKRGGRAPYKAHSRRGGAQRRKGQ
jgi:hypothetical protein